MKDVKCPRDERMGLDEARHLLQCLLVMFPVLLSLPGPAAPLVQSLAPVLSQVLHLACLNIAMGEKKCGPLYCALSHTNAVDILRIVTDHTHLIVQGWGGLLHPASQSNTRSGPGAPGVEGKSAIKLESMLIPRIDRYHRWALYSFHREMAK